MRRVWAAWLLVLAPALPANAQIPAAPALPADAEAAGSPAAPAPPGPKYAVVLKTRHACVVPHSRKLARADGGYIDVAQPAPQAILGTMTGSTVANSYLGCTGTAAEVFELVQDFEVTCDDPHVRAVSLTLDAVLIGFVRSKGHAGAAVRRAEVVVASAESPDASLSQSFPVLAVEGTGGRLCNQHLPALEAPAMPLGRYTLVARFELDARASGVCDAHSLADFSPDTELPAEWVRRRDPFQSVSKRPFGFSFSLTASHAHTVSGAAAPLSAVAPSPPLDHARPAERPRSSFDPDVRTAHRGPHANGFPKPRNSSQLRGAK